MMVQIPTQLCDLAVKDFEVLHPIDAAMREDASIINHEHRNTTIRFANPEHWLGGVMYDIGLRANSKWCLNVSSHEPIQYAEYREGQHYNWHIDTFLLSGRPEDRKISVICLLNDPEDFEGGVLEFNDGPQFLSKGSVIAFPSFLMHRVTPVTKGIRKTATIWITGAPFR